MTRAICPACAEEIGFSDRVKVGQRVNCQRCAEKLIVLNSTPVVLEWSDGEDWGEKVTRNKQATRTRRRGGFDPRASAWYEDTDWDEDDAGRRIKRQRNNKKRAPGQRDRRRHRYSRDEVLDDF